MMDRKYIASSYRQLSAKTKNTRYALCSNILRFRIVFIGHHEVIDIFKILKTIWIAKDDDDNILLPVEILNKAQHFFRKPIIAFTLVGHIVDGYNQARIFSQFTQ